MFPKIINIVFVGTLLQCKLAPFIWISNNFIENCIIEQIVNIVILAWQEWNNMIKSNIISDLMMNNRHDQSIISAFHMIRYLPPVGNVKISRKYDSYSQVNNCLFDEFCIFEKLKIILIYFYEHVWSCHFPCITFSDWS